MAGGLIVDVPWDAAVVDDEIRCVHVRTDGRRCARRAKEHNECCDVHYPWQISRLSGMGMRFPEDAISLQLMLGKALELLISGRVPAKDAKAVVEICKLMAHNVRAFEFEIADAERLSRKRRLQEAGGGAPKG